MKLILGTANWVNRYGIYNYRVLKEEIEKILNYALEMGIEYIETSTAYNVPPEYLEGFKVIMKFQKEIPKGDYIIMAHGFEYLRDGIQNVSIDTLEEAVKAIAIDRNIIELPYNILDNRFESTIKIAHEKGIKIISRSVFLQGLILMDDPLTGKEYVEKLDSIIKPYGISRKEAAFLFTYGNPYIDYIVIGVDSVDQLKELHELTNHVLPEKLIQELLENFQDVPEKIINPWRWNF
jgi:aryl-alcohol dehydrogenase-like predicted oxidoreductase